MIEKDIEYLDEFFPKDVADSKRGYAMVLLALARRQGELNKKVKCKICGEEFPITLMAIECPKCYLQGIKNERRKQK